MTAAEVLAHAAGAGIIFTVDDGGALHVRPRAALTDELRAGIGENKARLVAAFRLRELHRQMGFDETDLVLIEQAIVGGTIAEVVIVVRPPEQAPAS